NRQNGNRLFDSENNDNGGYSCPRAFPFACYELRYGSQQAFNACRNRNSNIENLPDEEQKTFVDSNGNLVKALDENNQPIDNSLIVNTPVMHYFSGTVLNLEWTVQHGLGPNDETHSEIIIQYSCDHMMTDNCGERNRVNEISPFIPNDNIFKRCSIRDGTPVAVNANNPTLNEQATDTIPENTASQDDFRYGRHETYNYYKECRNRERNKGLYVADQDLNCNDARCTRQDPNRNNRYGLECPEEAQYYPYWHHSPWIDIAVVVEDEGKCGFYRSESQNVKPRGRCDCGVNGNGNSNCPNDAQQPNNKQACEDEGYTWVTDPAHGYPPPECVVAEFNRQNHLGNVGGGTTSNQFNWTIPDVLFNERCVLRYRYNISTTDKMNSMTGGVDTRGNGGIDVTQRATAAQNGNGGPLYDNDENQAKTYLNMAGVTGEGAQLGFAINTDQYGRTFQDRSYVFEIRPRDGKCNDKKIHNLNVRGKRGNIVQAYPAVEYDFVPSKLEIEDDECVHVQWVGSDYNPARNGNNGEAGPFCADTRGGDSDTRADRSNLVQMARAGDNFPIMNLNNMNLFKADTNTYRRLVFLDQQVDSISSCENYALLKDRTDENGNTFNRARIEADHHNCMKLSGQKTPYFDAGVLEIDSTLGDLYFMSTRNNNFSNRGQKGKISVVRGTLSPLAITAIVAASIAFAVAGIIVYRRKFRRTNPLQSEGVMASPGSRTTATYSKGNVIHGTAAFDGHLGYAEESRESGARRSRKGLTAMFGGALGAMSGSSKANGSRTSPMANPSRAGIVVALYDHEAKEEGELSFSKGDHITVLSRDSSGWWAGEVNGQRGVFPSNYVRQQAGRQEKGSEARSVRSGERGRSRKMYSTKQAHKMQGVAFLNGPFTESHRVAAPDRFRGKQFLTKFPKSGNPSENGVLFSTVPAWGKPEPYAVGNKYLKTHPLDDRKLGFGSHDAPKKDEFMSGQRAEQHKHAMKSFEQTEKDSVMRNGSVDDQIERLHQKVAEIDAKYPGFSTATRAEDDFVGKVSKHLYNIGNTEEGSTSVFLKDARDSFFSQKRCKESNKPRHVQRLATTSDEYGLRTFAKGVDSMITLGGTKGNAGTFVDKGHLRVGNHDE
ncbi:Protein DD3-3, partial [Durusdinium trenchii]